MPDTDFDQRFSGTRRLYGPAACQRLAAAHVLVIGIGGVGSWVAEGLARSAIGRITLMDLDDVCVTNVNRQLHALDGTIGRSKVAVMAERVRAINPACDCRVIEDFLTLDNLAEHLDGDYDHVVDAIDNARVKAALIHHCRRRKLSVLTVGGAGGQIDPLAITVGDLNRTVQDPLAARVRSHLRRLYGYSRNPQRRYGVECVYSTEQLRYPQPDGSVCAQRPAEGTAMRLDCASGFGAAACVTASFGFVAVSRVIRRLLARTGDDAAGKAPTPQ